MDVMMEFGVVFKVVNVYSLQEKGNMIDFV